MQLNYSDLVEFGGLLVIHSRLIIHQTSMKLHTLAIIAVELARGWLCEKWAAFPPNSGSSNWRRKIK